MSFLKKLIPGHHAKADDHSHDHDASHSHSTTSSHTHGAVGVAPVGVVGVPVATSTTTTTTTTGVVAAPVATGVATRGATSEQTMVLSEEKLVVGKRQEEVGGVDISKHIERHTESVPVTLNREVVSVERRPIAPGTAASYAGASTFGQDQHITATVSAEQAVVAKTIVPTEQVHVSKTRVAETQVVQGAVRTENVEVKEHGAAPVARPRGASGAAVGAGVAPRASGPVASGSVVDASGNVTAFEEHLAVGKERVATGQVDVHKRVDTAMASAPVRLEHDEVAITRTAPTGPIAVPTSLSQGTVHIGLGRETAQVGTVVVPKEEIVIRKGVQTEQQVVTGEVMRERIDVATAGAVHADPAASAAAQAQLQAQAQAQASAQARR